MSFPLDLIMLTSKAAAHLVSFFEMNGGCLGFFVDRGGDLIGSLLKLERVCCFWNIWHYLTISWNRYTTASLHHTASFFIVCLFVCLGGCMFMYWACFFEWFVSLLILTVAVLRMLQLMALFTISECEVFNKTCCVVQWLPAVIDEELMWQQHKVSCTYSIHMSLQLISLKLINWTCIWRAPFLGCLGCLDTIFIPLLHCLGQLLKPLQAPAASIRD